VCEFSTVSYVGEYSFSAVFFSPVGSTEDVKGVADSSKLAVKKPRPKASSPNRQGPQQCQVGKTLWPQIDQLLITLVNEFPL
jgi:hypothetical protein